MLKWLHVRALVRVLQHRCAKLSSAILKWHGDEWRRRRKPAGCFGRLSFSFALFLSCLLFILAITKNPSSRLVATSSLGQIYYPRSFKMENSMIQWHHQWGTKCIQQIWSSLILESYSRIVESSSKAFRSKCKIDFSQEYSTSLCWEKWYFRRIIFLLTHLTCVNIFFNYLLQGFSIFQWRQKNPISIEK